MRKDWAVTGEVLGFELSNCEVFGGVVNDNGLRKSKRR